ncbi:uncharacterized protein BCR38DRAFT_419776 [Pseudomassariella vexata]|uniref:Uncharacterized protein n=1 Tax=Pseudomassariella vexata TaxID=1141098 RepID=A0A1Y2EDM5_9PEZI|nr:uncharacterized protein BCR38DRAFT_419776 [Pseudomassariella vexata]ORY69678.1 hypothetical protein BCR38DRAFT_419776 [Pseudomassariella vexata]
MGVHAKRWSMRLNGCPLSLALNLLEAPIHFIHVVFVILAHPAVIVMVWGLSVPDASVVSSGLCHLPWLFAAFVIRAAIAPRLPHVSLAETRKS